MANNETYEPRKKVYKRPTLCHYGSVSELTMGGSGPTKEGMMMTAMIMFP